MSTAASASARRKDLGAFYTDEEIVRFLVNWGMRSDPSRVMDPSCGDGRFLKAAADNGAKELIACDIDSDAIAATRRTLLGSICHKELFDCDFFAIDPGTALPVDLVVGNPPFIRYQRFSGASRKRALESALRVGVKLTGLTSSWAPFLLHAMQFLRVGGDLAMVVPSEIIQTQYGLPTLHALTQRFESITLLAFERNLFPDAQAETLLLLARGLGGAHSPSVQLIPLRDRSDLARLEGGLVQPPSSSGGLRVEVDESHDSGRFAEAFLTQAERTAWRTARELSSVKRLGDLGTLANGYVSGDNAFFHRSRGAFGAAGFPEAWLRPTARRSRSLRGLYFTPEDIEQLEEAGESHHLVVPEDDLFSSDQEALDRLLEEGEGLGVPERFKCRSRSPWWRVPGLARPDVILTYMSGCRPRAALNSAGSLHTNTLHGLRLRDPGDALKVATLFHSTLTLLSHEVRGRSYGGGILKLEPTEMQRVLVAWPVVSDTSLRALAADIDALFRCGDYQGAVRAVDRAALVNGLGLSETLVGKLRSARERLSGRRQHRSSGGSA